LAPTDLSLGDTFEPRPLHIIGLDATLGRRPLQEQTLEGASRYADDPSVFPDGHPELDGFSLGVPPGILRKGEKHESAPTHVYPIRHCVRSLF
jgi:hypothetical protein